MCGIAGIALRSPTSHPDSTLIQTMCDLIRHRGPDDDGYYCDESVSIGMRRLSIVDVAGGHQPMQNEDGSVWVVFNGEVYNFQELRDQLQRSGHTFRTRSDTECIVHAYETYGDDCVSHLEGMFAIAIWDARRKSLTLTRDRFGKKPLFYTLTSSALVFGSEIKCLLAHPEVQRTIDPRALDDYLTLGYILAPNTIFEGIQKLEPGHVLSFQAGQLQRRRYWQLPPRPAGSPGHDNPPAGWRDELTRLLVKAVEKRLVADVPLGAFLSAGIDSSLVVALMTKVSSGPVKTFTIGFDEPGYDESRLARETASRLNTEHHEFVVRPDFERELPVMIWGMDEPQADPSLVPTYYVSRLASQYVKVCLTGDGGDEIFAGYNRYTHALQEQSKYDSLPTIIRQVAGSVGNILPPGVKGRQRLLRISSDWRERYVSGLVSLDTRHRLALYAPDWVERLGDCGSDGGMGQFLTSPGHTDRLSALQWADVNSYLADDILAKVDRMSMINSLEARTPLLDVDLAEFVFSLPGSVFHDGDRGKLPLRDLVRQIVGADLLGRPKSGFGIPIGRWLAGPLKTIVDDVLLGGQLAQRGWFEATALAQLRQNLVTGRLEDSRGVWSLLCLELWARQNLDPSASALRAPALASLTANRG